MKVYFLNAARPSHLVTSIIQKQGGGAIINISTFAAFEPNTVFPTPGVTRAGLAAFLASQGRAYITGQNIQVVGGITRSV